MVGPSAPIVLTAIQKQRLTRWARAATTAQRWRDVRASFWAVPPDTRYTAAGATGTDESDNGAALACSLPGERVRRAAGSTTPRTATRPCTDHAPWWWPWRANGRPIETFRSVAIACR